MRIKTTRKYWFGDNVLEAGSELELLYRTANGIRAKLLDGMFPEIKGRRRTIWIAYNEYLEANPT